MWSQFQEDCFFRWQCPFNGWKEHRDLCRLWSRCYFPTWSSDRSRTHQSGTESIPRFSEKRKCIPKSDQHNCFIGEQHTSNIFIKAYILWDIDLAALMSSNHTTDRDSKQPYRYPETTIQQPRRDSCPVFASMRTMDSNRKGLCVSFAFFQKKYLPDGRVNETVATFEELSDLWKPGAMDGIPPFVLKCKCI